jgi:hypothetical protein
MSRAERLALVDRADPALSTVEQCLLLKVARSTLYYRGAGEPDDLAMRRMESCTWRGRSTDRVAWRRCCGAMAGRRTASGSSG